MRTVSGSTLSTDCDRPIVTARVYNGATKPHWHSNGLLSGYKSKEHQGSGYNQMVMDDATGQNRVQWKRLRRQRSRRFC
jgi:uncharacterized protein involved in type VI secretion and phage assembly